MFKLTFNTRTAKITDREIVTAGSAGMQVQVTFSSDWSGLNKTACFTGSATSRDVLESSWDGDIVTIPWECCKTAGTQLLMGVYGTDADGKVVIPTVMVQLDYIKAGADPAGDESHDPTPDVVAQLQEAIAEKQDELEAGDGITIEGNVISVTSEMPEKAVKSVNGKVGDVVLTASDVGAAEEEHTHGISDVTGLQDELDKIAEKAESTELTAETTARTEADTGLQTQITAIKTDVDDIKRVIDALYEEAISA